MSRLLKTLPAVVALALCLSPAHAHAGLNLVDRAGSFLSTLGSKALGFGVDTLLSELFGGDSGPQVVDLTEASMEAIADKVGERIDDAFRSSYLDQAEYALSLVDDYKPYEATAFDDARDVVEALMEAKAFLNNGDMFTVQAYLAVASAELAFRDELYRLKAASGASAAVLADYRADLARVVTTDLTYLEDMGDWVRGDIASTGFYWRETYRTGDLASVQLRVADRVFAAGTSVRNSVYVMWINGNRVYVSANPDEAAKTLGGDVAFKHAAWQARSDAILGAGFDAALTDMRALRLRYTMNDGTCTAHEMFAWMNGSDLAGADCAAPTGAMWGAFFGYFFNRINYDVFTSAYLWQGLAMQQQMLRTMAEMFHDTVASL
ncbi:MAG: hypothetical protein KC613_14110 [Myxococcales bacterium]|nr:hypothetical protein [Myxococcales bacterium]MCB9526136.1 hypothetical protein [Myxococcales bacterium]